MIPILLRLGPITIYSYGLMMALGFIAADLVCTREFKRRGFKPENASTLVLWTAAAGVAGARVLDIFNNWQLYAANPREMLLSGSGFVWYGGLAGGILASYLVARHYRIPFRVLLDMAAPAIAIGHAVGRIGCLLSGDGDWGLPSKLPWAMAYPHAIVGWTGRTVQVVNANNVLVPAPGCTAAGCAPWVRVHPAPVYETILYTGVFLILWAIRKKVHIDGQIFYIYLVLAGACRFLVEFIRVNPRVLWGLSEAQLIAIAMIVVGASAYVWSSARGLPHAAAKQAA
jgi:phosphatidylglycerol---prolipoprotein diacylglyceryl transferase